MPEVGGRHPRPHHSRRLDALPDHPAPTNQHRPETNQQHAPRPSSISSTPRSLPVAALKSAISPRHHGVGPHLAAELVGASAERPKHHIYPNLNVANALGSVEHRPHELPAESSVGTPVPLVFMGDHRSLDLKNGKHASPDEEYPKFLVILPGYSPSPRTPHSQQALPPQTSAPSQHITYAISIWNPPLQRARLSGFFGGPPARAEAGSNLNSFQ